MADQLFKEGDIITEQGIKLQCSFVSWRDTPTGEKENFVYSFRNHDDVEQERKDAELPSIANHPKEDK